MKYLEEDVLIIGRYVLQCAYTNTCSMRVFCGNSNSYVVCVSLVKTGWSQSKYGNFASTASVRGFLLLY